MVIIFDLDGTLLNTYPVLAHSLAVVFDKFTPEKEYTKKDIDHFFGPPLIDSFMQWTGCASKAQAMVKAYREYSHHYALKHIRVFPGVKEVLLVLKEAGHHIAICSNKIHSAVSQQLQWCGIDNYIDFIIGGDDVKKAKPNPEGIEKIKNKYQDACMMVGDSVYDIQAAKRAGIPTIGVTWGLLSKEDFIVEKADFVIDKIDEILEIVRRY